MAKIPVSYQPNKIKKGSYTDWIDGGKFCTTADPNGSDTPPASGLNLLDAFDVDWSAYKLGGQPASANKIIEKLNEQLLLPQSPDRLIYYNEGEGFVSDYLVLNDGTLVVDNDPDLDLCKGESDIETDILGAWQLWTEIKSTSPEYGTGTYTTNLGYGRWYTNTNGEVLNKVNSTDFNGYIMPFARLSYAIESVLGTNVGNTTGDNIGFSIVNDKNAVPRHVITNAGRTYYRNTLYDIYADGASGESTAIHPIKSAWVCDDKTANTAYVIYTTSPTSGAEANLSGDHLVYYIDNIKTSKGRRKYKTTDLTTDNSVGTETVTTNVAASGTIDFISITVTNSASMELGHSTGVSGSTGTVYVFGSRYNVSAGSWSNEKVFTGTSTDLGNLLVAYLDSLNTNASGKACIIKTYVDFNKGVLTIKFSDSTKYGETPTYNDSVLKIDFTKKKYYITPRSDYENLNIVENSLPASTLNSDFWDGFTNDTKFMYHAFSYQNLYIKCLNVLMDNKIIYVHDDGTNIEFGPNADRSDYEAKGNISTQDVLKGSRLVYNPITKKTFYSDGTKIFHIASVNADTEDTPVTGEYLPLAGGEMLGHIDMLDSSIIWDDWNSSIGDLGGQLVITGGEGLVFNGVSWFNNDILPNSTGIHIGDSGHFFHEAYINSIITDLGLFYNDLFDDGRSIITINGLNVLRVSVDEGGHRTFILGDSNNTDCFTVNSDAFDINCAAGGTNIYGYLSILDSDEGPAAELSINSEGALEISNSTNIQGGLHSTASDTCSNVLLGLNNPGANEPGFTDMGTDITKNGYPLVVSTSAQMADGGEGQCLVFGPGDIYALQKDTENGGYKSSTLYLQHRGNYFGDVLIGQDLTVGYFGEDGGVGGNLTVQGLSTSLNGFKKTGYSDDYVLLAGGGTKLLSDITGAQLTGDYLPLSGGEMSGSICMNSNPISFDLDSFCQIYEDSGQLHVKSDEGVVFGNNVYIGQEARITSSQDGSTLTISCEGITLQAGDEVKLATGYVTSTGSVSAPAFYETSDIRKKNIKSDLSLDKCYELIDKCQTVIYSLKDQTQEQIGMIAQEVEQFFPELVDTDKEGFKSLAYDRLVIVCFKVLKDVIKRLEKLESDELQNCK